MFQYALASAALAGRSKGDFRLIPQSLRSRNGAIDEPLVQGLWWGLPAARALHTESAKGYAADLAVTVRLGFTRQESCTYHSNSLALKSRGIVEPVGNSVAVVEFVTW